MKKVINQRNYKPGKGKKSTEKSLTVQDEAISIADLLRKHITGQEVKGKQGVYIDDPDEDDVDGQQFTQMDPVDQQDVLEGIRAMGARLKTLEREYAEAQKARQKQNTEASKQPKNEG